MPDARFAEVFCQLKVVGVDCLVMGWHAVRFYGLFRHTNDVDLHVTPDQWDELPARLTRSSLFAGRIPVEGPSWRPGAFRRFQIGTLPDGREEWLEFWSENHLLAPHSELQARAERGEYGGREVTFLGLMDLIRSKETERDADWQDITVLERFLDARLLARLRSGAVAAGEALAALRSQSGLLGYLEVGVLTVENAAAALAKGRPAEMPATAENPALRRKEPRGSPNLELSSAIFALSQERHGHFALRGVASAGFFPCNAFSLPRSA